MSDKIIEIARGPQGPAGLGSSVAYVTPDGGYAVKKTNATGAASIKGTVLTPSSVTAGGVDVASADAYNSVGIMYSDGVADGGDVWVVVSGMAYVLIKDGTAAILNGWVEVSDVAGRANASGAVPSPPTDSNHFQEIGHCDQAVEAGTDQLARIYVHFN